VTLRLLRLWVVCHSSTVYRIDYDARRDSNNEVWCGGEVAENLQLMLVEAAVLTGLYGTHEEVLEARCR